MRPGGAGELGVRTGATVPEGRERGVRAGCAAAAAGDAQGPAADRKRAVFVRVQRRDSVDAGVIGTATAHGVVVRGAAKG